MWALILAQADYVDMVKGLTGAHKVVYDSVEDLGRVPAFRVAENTDLPPAAAGIAMQELVDVGLLVLGTKDGPIQERGVVMTTTFALQQRIEAIKAQTRRGADILDLRDVEEPT